MALYEFRCDECNANRDLRVPVSEIRQEQRCEECGSVLRRIFSLVSVRVKVGGREKVLGALNKEEGYSLPGENNKHDWRYLPALAKGLEHDGQPGRYRSGVSATSREG